MFRTLTLIAVLALASRAVQAPSVPVYVLVYTAQGGTQWAHLNGATFVADPKYPTVTVGGAGVTMADGVTPILSLEPDQGLVVTNVKGKTFVGMEHPQ